MIARRSNNEKGIIMGLEKAIKVKHEVTDEIKRKRRL